MRECTLITESRVEECGIVAQVVKCAPRVCGDDPHELGVDVRCDGVLPAYAGMIHQCRKHLQAGVNVLPAYAGMIPSRFLTMRIRRQCSPRMRG